MAIEDWIPYGVDYFAEPEEPECNRCGRRIWWLKRETKWVPISGDGEDHLSVCPARRAKASEFPKLED